MLDKIKKLWALALNPSASPGEAENARRMAQRLMDREGIQWSDLTDHDLAAELGETTARAARPGKKNAAVVPLWINLMAVGVSRFTRTRLELGAGVARFRGLREDTTLAAWLLEHLIDQAYAASRTSPDPQGFRNGYASEIQRRLKAMSAPQEAGGESTALTLYDRLPALMDAQWGPDPASLKKRNVNASQEGRTAGQAAGIPTDRPLARTQIPAQRH